jgi:tetratricopeptide (TPR) repeat protein
MRSALLVLAALIVSTSAPAQAPAPQAPAAPRQATPPQQPAEQPPAARPQRGPQQNRGAEVAPGPGPEQRGEAAAAATRRSLLDQLFAKLKETQDRAEATALDQAIGTIFARTGSPTIDLMMDWAMEETARNQRGRARDYLDTILTLDPNHAEAYFRRAQLSLVARDTAKAVADLERAIALEPRHYGALVVLGSIMRELQRDREALAAFRAALDLNPHIVGARRLVEQLGERVDGRGI